MQALDETTLWSETEHICNKSMRVQIEKLYRMQHLRHGSPKYIRCDREFDNSEFASLCEAHGTTLIKVVANDQEANGAKNTITKRYVRTSIVSDRLIRKAMQT